MPSVLIAGAVLSMASLAAAQRPPGPGEEDGAPASATAGDVTEPVGGDADTHRPDHPDAADADAEDDEDRRAAAVDDAQDPNIEAETGGVRVVAGLREGVRVEVPEAADFVFEAHLAAWARLEVDVPIDGDASDYFEVPLVRPVLQASVFDGMFRLLVQPELAGANPRLLDLHLDFVLHPAFRIRIGQFRTPMSRAYITPIINLQMPGRGVVSDTFRAGRDTGLMVFGTAGAFEYDVGVFNGSGIDGRLGDTPAPMVVGRVALAPYGSVPYDQTPSLTDPSPSGLSIGLDGFFRERDIADPADPQLVRQTANGGIDLALIEGPFTIFAEAYLRGQRVNAGDWQPSWGAYAQVGLFVIPQILEISARGSWIDPDTEVGGNLVQAYDANLAGYFYFDDVAYGNHLKLLLRYRFADTVSPFAGLAGGSSHRVTVQLQAWM